MHSCDPKGSCRAECPAAIAEVRAENGCLRNTWGYLYEIIMHDVDDVRMTKFAAAMESCTGRDGEVEVTTAKPPVMTTKPTGQFSFVSVAARCM